MEKTILAQAVASYISDEFETGEIAQSARMSTHEGTAFLINTADEKYELRILDEAVIGKDVKDIILMLKENNTSQIMRELRGFAVTITHNGCIFL